jgi:formylglycine-generating enzyme required for sulfatase activity
MHGNIWEWCQDTWHENYNRAPADGRPWMSANNKRLLRGGSWSNDPEICRSAGRFWFARDVRLNDGGFRVVVAAPLRT